MTEPVALHFFAYDIMHKYCCSNLWQQRRRTQHRTVDYYVRQTKTRELAVPFRSSPPFLMCDKKGENAQVLVLRPPTSVTNSHPFVSRTNGWTRERVGPILDTLASFHPFWPTLYFEVYSNQYSTTYCCITFCYVLLRFIWREFPGSSSLQAVSILCG